LYAIKLELNLSFTSPLLPIAECRRPITKHSDSNSPPVAHQNYYPSISYKNRTSVPANEVIDIDPECKASLSVQVLHYFVSKQKVSWSQANRMASVTKFLGLGNQQSLREIVPSFPACFFGSLCTDANVKSTRLF